MKAAVVNAMGCIAPIYTEFPDPQPRDGAVVATVEASALTNLTRGLVSGKHYASKELQLPAIPGVDGRGPPRRRSHGCTPERSRPTA